MCGRLVREKGEDANQFGFAEFSEMAIIPRFNVGPMQLDLMIRAAPEDQGREFVESWWGLVSRWATDAKVGNRAFNVRAETLTERPTFRGLVDTRRAIVPASGYYEWRTDGASTPPYYIRPRDGSPIAFAALWDVWTDPTTGDKRTSHTIITTEPNAPMSIIYNRMPVILDTEGLSMCR